MRIVSLLPSATEIVYALGLGDDLVAVTHECDFPIGARAKRQVTRNLIPTGHASAEIDRAVLESSQNAHSIYRLDIEVLVALRPDLILTQDLCAVCAVPRSAVDEAVQRLDAPAAVLSLDPTNLEDVLLSIEQVGEATGYYEEARRLVTSLRQRIEAVVAATSGVSQRPRVFCCDWLDPVFCSGHWVPQQVLLAGGVDGLGQEAGPAISIDWQEVLWYAPEVIILMPCGFDASHATAHIDELAHRSGWDTLPAVTKGRVYVVDASAYFSRPGPRLVDGLELLARILHSESFPKLAPSHAALKSVPRPAGASSVENRRLRFEPYI